MSFFIHGTKTGKTKSQFKQILSSLGASVASKVNDSTAVISTAADVAKMAKNMKEAEAADVPVLAAG